MQLRRILLLFALVLGVSAVVAELVPPPAERNEEDPREDLPTETAAPGPAPARPTELAVTVPPAGARDDAPVTRRARADSRATLTVRVPEPGDVVIEGLGLRQSADTLAPARFDLFARPAGRYAVSFEPLRGEDRIVARLVFEPAATVRPPRRGR